MSDGAKWYVVITYSGYENKVKSSLEKTIESLRKGDMILDIKMPMMVDEKGVERKLFPGYLFIKMVMTPETRYIVRNIRGCAGFAGDADPLPLSDEDVRRMGVETKIVEVNYEVGDSVRISDSPLEGNIGVVEEISLERRKVKVVVTMFGRETPVELDIDQVEPLS